jgi:hypothetical protein
MNNCGQQRIERKPKSLRKKMKSIMSDVFSCLKKLWCSLYSTVRCTFRGSTFGHLSIHVVYRGLQCAMKEYDPRHNETSTKKKRVSLEKEGGGGGE